MKNNSIIICILKLKCEEKQMSNNEYNISEDINKAEQNKQN